MLIDSKRGGTGKVIAWIIITLVIIRLLVLAFNYLGGGDGAPDQDGEDQEQDGGDTQQNGQINNVVDDIDLGEKPPRPPE